MKIYTTLISVLCLTVHADYCSACIEKESLLVMFWNLENFFDWKDMGYSDSDREFSSSGNRRWTKNRFYVKRNAVVKSILWTGELNGRLPDAIGFAEVENAEVVKSLIHSDALKKYGYGYIHYDSPDPRGIDVALIYRKESLEYLESKSFAVGKMPVVSGHDTISMDFISRDILYSKFRDMRNGGQICILVNHHPSKYGGERVSKLKRHSALATLKAICDSLTSSGMENIIAMGDFNDSPGAGVFDILYGNMCSVSDKLYSSGKGTIKFKGKWELIDLFFVSENLAGKSEMKICQIPFLLVQDSAYSGKKPKRTYSGPIYSGGVSDHCPIVLSVNDK